MTGPEHYREAERLLEARQDGDTEYGTSAADDTRIRAEMVAIAQVHATLALAAATALHDTRGGMPDRDWNAWCKAAGVQVEAVTA